MGRLIYRLAPLHLETLLAALGYFVDFVFMAGRYLSAEELLNQSKKGNDLPNRGGRKDDLPDGSWLQEKKIQNFFKEELEILSEERVTVLSALSLGEWKPDLGKILVKKNVGKFWKNMGHMIKGEMFLLPEEALFLVDQGSMEIYWDDRPMSVQECYSILLGPSCTLDEYLVYGHLVRLGYIARRVEKKDEDRSRKRKKEEGGEDDIENGDGNADVETSSKKFKSSSWCEDGDGENKMIVEACQTTAFDHEEPFFISSTSNVPLPFSSPSNIPISSSSLNTSISSPPQPSRNFPSVHSLPASEPSFPSFDLFNVFKTASDVVVYNPPSDRDLLPGVRLSRPYDFDFSNVRRQLDVIAKDRSVVDKEETAGLCGPKNWKDFKSMSIKERMLTTEARILWEGDDDDDDDVVTPLVDPDAVKNIGDVFKSLKLFEDCCDFYNLSTNSDETGITYDVFLPNSKFKKSQPGNPSVCIHVSTSSSFPSLPRVQHLLKLTQERGGGTLMFAVVDDGNVTFTSFRHVSLPNLYASLN